jgi:hypothetical protein
MEIWKDIPNYEGLYQISNLGRVKSLGRIIINGKGKSFVSKEKILKYNKSSNGYSYVVLYRKSKTKIKSIHQLVAMVFLNHTPNGHKLVVDHINEIKTDNRLENLQIISQRENVSKLKKGTSTHTGVYWHKPTQKWLASIRINGKRKYLGLFKCETSAGLAYQRKLKEILI